MEDRLIKVFVHEEFGKIRIIFIEGEPWFVASDVCRALELENVTRALSRLDDDEKRKIHESLLTNDPNHCEGSTVTPFEHEINIISEPGLYGLIMVSRKQKAKDFQRWVKHEVLPSIMRTGAYISPNAKIISDSAADILSREDKQIACLLRCAELTNLDRLRNQFLREAAFISVGKKFY